ncbi:MAG: 50S ribosomal protein L28 [Firmicutes bacterium]|nr:50S ribosomal protein L28 [Bacillota bacterium]
MSRCCQLCGKGKMRGNTVSHSNRKAPRHYKPNLQKETFEMDGNDISIKICTKCKKTLNKKSS